MRNSIFDVVVALGVVWILGSGCGRSDSTGSDSHPEHEAESWALTAWGERYEIFAEMDPLQAGHLVASHTHVTVLDGFAPLREGVVSIVLRDAHGGEQVFRQDGAVRDGIFSVQVHPAQQDTVDLLFRIDSKAGSEDISGGRVFVGSVLETGRVIELPAATAFPRTESPATAAAEPISFLKEQQWRTEFATQWAIEDSLERALRGPARIRPAAGGDVVLSSPLDGVVSQKSKPFVGQEIRAGDSVVEIAPRVGADRSAHAIRSELEQARARLKRLEELLVAEAVSQAEVEEAKARVSALEAESGALEGQGSGTVRVRAPFTGRVAEVLVTPGEGVTAGQSLVRLVREEPLWVEVSLSLEEVSSISSQVAGLVLYLPAERSPLVLSASNVKVVARSPEVDRSTGTVTVILEVANSPSLRPGMALDAEILLPGSIEGIIVPPSAIVDDGGIPIVYVHSEGESFIRYQVRVVSRQGNKALIEGLPAGERIVAVGGSAIRRAALLQSGPVEGHVH